MNSDFKDFNRKYIKKIFKEDFFSAVCFLSKSIFSEQKYDSISMYEILFGKHDTLFLERGAVNILNKWDPNNLLKKKYGQDCYDILFKLIEILPEDIETNIFAIRNTEHISLKDKIPYYHFGIVVKDKITQNSFLIDWINVPIVLLGGSISKSEKNDSFFINKFDSSVIHIIKSSFQKNKTRDIFYEKVPKGFDVVQNYKNLMRVKGRLNQITCTFNKEVFYIKYNYLNRSFVTNISTIKDVIFYSELLEHEDVIDGVMGWQTTKKLINFDLIYNNLPDDFWLS